MRYADYFLVRKGLVLINERKKDLISRVKRHLFNRIEANSISKHYLCSMIRRQVIQYIEKEHLFSPEDKILVALSGGADSVALLCLLQSSGYQCEAAHCNFQLRGQESDRDEQFVRKLCLNRKTTLHITHFDTTRYATEKHISIEMAARELRYDWFYKIKKESNSKVIAVAHHKDDSVETMLLNLIRGTGINGLLGIRPKNGDIARPLLCVNREQIIQYLHYIGQSYVTDSTNLQDEHTRNKIRLHLLPIMQVINPSIKESLVETGNHLNKAAIIYNKGIEEGKKRVLSNEGIRIDALLNEPSPSALLFELLHPLGFNSTQIENIFHSLDGQSGKQFTCKDWRIIKDRQLLILEKNEIAEENAPPLHLIKKEGEYTSDFIIPKDKTLACFDADKLDAPLTLRKWQTGDTFIPFGMKGKKRISDYLTDRKFSLIQKERQWVLCCGEQIAWIIGERIDNRFKIDENTKNIILLKVANDEQ